MWMPVANIDVGAAGAAGQGTRPGLTPVHSGTVWSTYQITQQWRVGGGINLRGRQATLTNTHTVKSYATADLMAETKLTSDLRSCQPDQPDQQAVCRCPLHGSLHSWRRPYAAGDPERQVLIPFCTSLQFADW
jgi:hypothetical protein